MIPGIAAGQSSDDAVAASPDTTPPTITSSSAVSVAENEEMFHSLTADEPVTWSIVGGADQTQFTIEGSTLTWALSSSRDYEIPEDVGSDNTYNVTVRATDLSGNTTDQALTVTVTNVADTGASFADVVLQVEFNGADGATSATDVSNSAHTLTFVANAQLDTAIKNYGTASLQLDGTGDYVSIADHADFNFGAGAYCVEAFIYSEAAFQSGAIIGQWSFDTPANSWLLTWESGTVNFRTSSNGTSSSIVVTETNGAPNTGQWYHVCAERNASGVARLYVDGVMVDKRNDGTSAATLFNSTYDVRIGMCATSGTPFDFQGHVDGVRVQRAAPYDSDGGFTVPASEYPTS